MALVPRQPDMLEELDEIAGPNSKRGRSEEELEATRQRSRRLMEYFEGVAHPDAQPDTESPRLTRSITDEIGDMPNGILTVLRDAATSLRRLEALRASIQDAASAGDREANAYGTELNLALLALGDTFRGDVPLFDVQEQRLTDIR